MTEFSLLGQTPRYKARNCVIILVICTPMGSVFCRPVLYDESILRDIPKIHIGTSCFDISLRPVSYLNALQIKHKKRTRPYSFVFIHEILTPRRVYFRFRTELNWLLIKTRVA